MGTVGKVDNYERIIGVNGRQNYNYFQSLSILPEDERHCSWFMQKRYNISESTVSISYKFRKQKALVISVKWQKKSTFRFDCTNGNRRY
jgi:hypothetical protein